MLSAQSIGCVSSAPGHAVPRSNLPSVGHRLLGLGRDHHRGSVGSVGVRDGRRVVRLHGQRDLRLDVKQFGDATWAAARWSTSRLPWAEAPRPSVRCRRRRPTPWWPDALTGRRPGFFGPDGDDHRVDPSMSSTCSMAGGAVSFHHTGTVQTRLRSGRSPPAGRPPPSTSVHSRQGLPDHRVAVVGPRLRSCLTSTWPSLVVQSVWPFLVDVVGRCRVHRAGTRARLLQPGRRRYLEAGHLVRQSFAVHPAPSQVRAAGWLPTGAVLLQRAVPRLDGWPPPQSACSGHGIRPPHRRVRRGGLRRWHLCLPCPVLRFDGSPAPRRFHRGYGLRRQHRRLLRGGLRRCHLRLPRAVPRLDGRPPPGTLQLWVWPSTRHRRLLRGGLRRWHLRLQRPLPGLIGGKALSPPWWAWPSTPRLAAITR